MSLQPPRIYLPRVEFTTLYAREGDVLDIREATIVCIYDPFTGTAACTGVPPGGVVLVASNPIDMASALLTIDEKLRHEGIPAKKVQVLETMYYVTNSDKFIKEEVNIMKNALRLFSQGPLF